MMGTAFYFILFAGTSSEEWVELVGHEITAM